MTTYNLGVSGEFQITVNRAGNTIHDTGWQKNLVLSRGLDFLLGGVNTSTRFAGFCKLGTGTSTPTASQVDLDATVASKDFGASVLSNGGSPDYTHFITITYAFPLGSVVGNIAEIGLADSASANSSTTRARILDGVGNPTTLTVTAIDQLTVQYRLGFKYDLTDATGTAVIGGTSYGYTSRVMLAGRTPTFSGWPVVRTFSGFPGMTYCQPVFYGGTSALGAVTGSPSGTRASVAEEFREATWSAYTPGSFTRDFTISTTTASGNIAGGCDLLTFSLGELSGVNDLATQIKLDAKIPKDNTKTMTTVIRVTLAAL